MERRLLTLLAETPVHAGGPESLAAVDLPIQREAATRLPVIWGQSLKGALREAVHAQRWGDETALFGSPPPGVGDNPGGATSKGGLAVGDAQLLVLPAAALRQVFAWTTSNQLLNRLARKIALLGVATAGLLDPPARPDRGIGAPAWSGGQVLGPVLEDIAPSGQPARIGALLGSLVCPSGPEFDYTRRKIVDDLLVLPDGTLGTLAATGTDVVARVQLDDEKKVANGPFYSEQLPPETALVALLTGSTEHLDRLAGLLDGKVLQLGGDETIGKGLLWCRMHDAASVRRALPPAGPADEPATAPPDRPKAVPAPPKPAAPASSAARSGSPTAIPRRRP